MFIETTVVSYLTARLSKDLIVAAHQQITHEWWENSLKYFLPYISPVVLDEESKGDKEAARLRLEKIKNFTILKINSDINQLAETYYSSLPIPEKAKADTYHLAIASWYNVDFLVTWNCSHLAMCPQCPLWLNFSYSNPFRDILACPSGLSPFFSKCPDPRSKYSRKEIE